MSFRFDDYPWPPHAEEPLSPSEYHMWKQAEPGYLEKKWSQAELTYFQNFYDEFDWWNWRAKLGTWREYGHDVADYRDPDFRVPLHNQLEPRQSTIAASIAIQSLLSAFRTWADQFELEERDRLDRILFDLETLLRSVIHGGSISSRNLQVRDLEAAWHLLDAWEHIGDSNVEALRHSMVAVTGYLRGLLGIVLDYMTTRHGQTTWQVVTVQRAMDSFIAAERSKIEIMEEPSSRYEELEQDAEIQVILANRWTLGWWQAVQNVLAWRSAAKDTLGYFG